MTVKSKLLLSLASLFCLVVAGGTVYLIGQRILAMPFRAVNDTLHQQDAPITLDFLIPGGTHIDDNMTIGQVIKARIDKPKGKFQSFLEKISKIIPGKYLVLGSLVLYIFWTFLFLVFFRIFTWFRYSMALGISFFAGAVVYFFMPDLVLGRIDDLAFTGWAVAFGVTGWWFSRRHRPKYV
jgi:hypothetical protein